MPALRRSTQSTTESVSAIKNVLADKNTTRVIFFASARDVSGAYDEKFDGPSTNLPLVAALAEYTIPGFGPIWLVFDGVFLTYQLEPRKAEVDDVLDAAIASGKAYFSPRGAPFTASASPEIAANKLSALITLPLNRTTRNVYKRQL